MRHQLSATSQAPERWPVRAYRWLNRVSADEVLNNGAAGDAPSTDIADRLKQAINRLKAQAVNQTGGVDYAGLRGSAAFEEYQMMTRALRSFDPADLTGENEQRAFWINLYNALVIHAVIAYGVNTRITDVRGVFDRAAYRIGGQRYSANDIEHGILRANAGHPLLPGSHFHPNDPRARLAQQTLDSRIHFALVCGARSCPPINFYRAENLDSQLDVAARSFVNGGGVVVDRKKRTVRLSRIFAWYAGDFGGCCFGLVRRSELLTYAARYVENGADRDFILSAPRISVKYLPYDWRLNG